ASRSAQHLRERDARRKQRRQGQGRTSRNPSKVRCPWCNTMLERRTLAIRQHTLKTHRRLLSEPEAFRIASPELGGTIAPSLETLRKSVHQGRGGLPPPGKRG